MLAALLVLLPVFLQAPWVRLQPFSAALFTLPLLLLGLGLERFGRGTWKTSGPLLVGFSGSWLAGCLFWGWCREHPLWHLPIEAFALPLALTGLGGRWRMACSFYLASLLGTACTDAVMALIGVIRLWPAVVQAPPTRRRCCCKRPPRSCFNRPACCWCWAWPPPSAQAATGPGGVIGTGPGTSLQPPWPPPWPWMACFSGLPCWPRSSAAWSDRRRTALQGSRPIEVLQKPSAPGLVPCSAPVALV